MGSNTDHSSKQRAPSPKISRPPAPPESYHQDHDNIQEVEPILKSEPVSAPAEVVPQQQQCAASGQQSQQQVKLEDESYDCGEFGDGGYDDGSGIIDPNTGLSIQGAGGADGNKAVVEMTMWKETTADRGLVWRCADCDYTAKLKRGMFEHVESKHVGSLGYTCLYCGKHCPSKNALRSHVSRNHPKKLRERGPPDDQ